MLVRWSFFPALVVLLLASPALSDSIFIPNASFESPVTPPPASPVIDDWQKSPVPDYWGALGYAASDWFNSAGIFPNTSPFIDNAYGSQVGFMFSNPGLVLSQTLTSTYQIGSPYQLTVGIEGGGYGMSVGYPMQIGLYYMSGGSQTLLGTTTVLNNNSGPITHLTDYTLTIPPVAAIDPWAGQNIGVALIQTGGPQELTGGYWDIDNVRLAPVPEPGTIGLLAAAAVSLFALRRRRLFARRTVAAHD